MVEVAPIMHLDKAVAERLGLFQAVEGRKVAYRVPFGVQADQASSVCLLAVARLLLEAA